jgi:hypothetical protein
VTIQEGVNSVPIVCFDSSELGEKKADLQKLIMEFAEKDRESALRDIDALSSQQSVQIIVPKERESEFTDKMKQLGAQVSG